MSEPVNDQQSEHFEQVEENKLLEPSPASAENENKKDNALVETAELLNAVSELTHDAYINTVRQAQSFVKFLHKKIKS
ncbi:MAG: hypothetical protein KME49_25620 [Brasilonema octagenarum HA4186-MV1]|jgi:hypothetical protein|nr:hypothetical protein [Brasilonema octagenarum HA4186-MV1]